MLYILLIFQSIYGKYLLKQGEGNPVPHSPGSVTVWWCTKLDFFKARQSHLFKNTNYLLFKTQVFDDKAQSNTSKILISINNITMAYFYVDGVSSN